MLMTVLGLVGSERKNGNTDTLVQHVLQGVISCGIDTELIHLSDLDFSPCNGCEGCRDSFRCVKKDDMQTVYDKLNMADGIVLGSPTYFYNMTAITKAFIERLYCYCIFDETDRSIWLSHRELFGAKYAVTVAICEQNNIEDMGYTATAMDRSLQSVGYRIVEGMKVLHLFNKNDSKKDADILDSATAAGIKLAKTILLAERLKKSI